ncbi:MAG: hypothetical protein ABMA15_24730, partial [Vicinamibacterales bacterium]
MAPTLTKFEDLPCCPVLDTDPICDVVDLRRRLVFPTPVRGPREQALKVEVIVHTRFTRCSGPMALGDIAYTTTLLPGEKVRLATTDRRSRFSFDSESKLSYRSEQISEEQYRLRALRALMTDENVVDRGSDNYSEQGKWDFHGDASGSIGFFSAGADANARGSHSASSASDYLREHRAHAEMADSQSVEATRRAHSLSIGEVSSRTHSQGESEDHFEASSREFTNHNQCHAVTFLFYRINKTETIRFELISIERRVLDPVTPMPVPANPFRPLGQIATIPQEVPATNAQRVAALDRSIASDQKVQAQALAGLPRVTNGVALLSVNRAVAAGLGDDAPLEDAVRAKALAFVDEQLAKQGLLDKPGGVASPKAKADMGYERKTSIPTAGVVVKTCLDGCSACEPNLEKKIELELAHLELQNKLLARQIELLEKSQ